MQYHSRIFSKTRAFEAQAWLVLVTKCLIAIYFILYTTSTSIPSEYIEDNIIVSHFVYRYRGTSEIRFFYDMTDDCETHRGFTISVTRLPKHGVARLEKATKVVATSWAVGKNKMHCIGKTIPVIKLFYTPNENFSGFDDLLVTSDFPRTKRRRNTEIKIGVK